MNEEIISVGVNILGKEYRIACADKERDELLASAQHLDQKMREIRDSGRIVGMDKVAIMAALNIAHEMTQLKSQNQYLSKTITNRLDSLGKKINTAMESVDS